MTAPLSANCYKVISLIQGENWYTAKPDEDLHLVRIDQYRKVDKWDQRPYFMNKDKLLVRPHLFYPRNRIDDARPIRREIFSRPEGTTRVGQNLLIGIEKTNAFTLPQFENCIGYFADLAIGKFPPRPWRITGKSLSPKGVLAPIQCYACGIKALQPEKVGWQVLIPLAPSDCKELPVWDGLPVFNDKDGNLTRPYVLLEKENDLDSIVMVAFEDSYGGPFIVIEPYPNKVTEKPERFRLSLGGMKNGLGRGKEVILTASKKPLFSEPLSSYRTIDSVPVPADCEDNSLEISDPLP